MKKSLVLAVALALVALIGQAFAGSMDEKHKNVQGKDMGPAMKCEVVDVACYVAKGEKGEKHTGCAAKCISEGGELALLYNGKLYIPVDQKFHSARKKFVSKGGEMVNVHGKTISKDGLNYIQLADTGK